ncbi:MAG TPA: ATP-binding protein [Burkholderiales bacterium]|nr:ATP-binding protein [Burkholderiales bacterium]
MRSLNRHVLLVVLSALVPLLAVAVALAFLLVEREREATEGELRVGAQRLAQAVDAELQRSFAALHALSRSDALQRGDLKSFYDEASEVRAALGLWDNLLLLSPSAEHLLNLMRPYGTRLPAVPQPEGTLEAARTMKPYVSNALRGRVETDWLMYIAYPVVQEGKVTHVIGATMNYRYWSKWLGERTSPGRIAAIIDRDYRFIARTEEGERLAGQLVQPWYREALAASPAGLVRGRGALAADVVSAFDRSALSGWHINVLTSGAAVDAPMLRTALAVSLAVLAALAVAIALTLSRVSVLTRGIRALQEALEALKDARRLPALASPVKEVQAAMDAAQATAEELATRAERLERDMAARQEAEARLRESEEKFRTISHAAPAIVWVTDDKGIVFINRRWTELTGQSQEEAQGQGWTRAVHPDDSERLRPYRERCRRTGEPYEGEIRYRAKEGAYRWHAFRALPSEAGRLDQWFGVSVDIHDAWDARQALEEADRRKDEFLATLAHELRNPLAPIRNALQLLQLRPAEDPTMRAAQEILERQVTHMVRLIDDLLDVSRITRGKLELRREPVELSRIVEQAIETSRPHIAQQLTVALPSDPVRLDADPVRLAQVLANLLNNAAKFTPRSGRIDLTAALEGGTVVIRVRDNGVGIAPEQLPNLFRIFSQAEPALERSKGGLGIGLSLARSLVELHDGAIEARSEGPGKGAEFIVRLPVLALPDPAALPPQPPRPAYSGAVRRVLVVDDVPDNVDSLAALLRNDGNIVETAADGLEAVAKAERFKPDLILLDLGLPNLNGFEACQLIRRKPWGKGIVIVALTGWGQDEDRRRSLGAGFDAHLVKPVPYGALREVLASPLMG